MPSHFDRTGGQIELWPVPERDYGLVVEWDSTHYKFTEKTDRCPVSSRLIFLRALATAKAHYRMPDAQQTAASYNELLSYERGRNVTDKHYSLSNKRSDGGYQVAVGADGTFFAKRY